MNPQVEQFLTDGCGRCSKYRTPQCKVIQRRQELEQLRLLVLEFDLKEEIKWGAPAYTREGKNVVMVHAFKDYSALMLFKGALIPDPHGLIVKAGENTQAGRQVRFRDMDEIQAKADIVRAILREAVELEKSGKKVEYKPADAHPIPSEFQAKLDESAELHAAFKALTPGRQRAYLMHFSAPKQSKTRESRIAQCTDMILKGIGLNEEYRNKKRD